MLEPELAEQPNRSGAGVRRVERVAIVLTELRAGGMERVVAHLANSLAERNVEPYVICLQQKGPLAAELEAGGIRVEAIGSTRSYDAQGLLRLTDHLRRFAPDIINVHDYSSLPYAAVAGLSRRRCPIIFTAHGLLYQGFDGRERRYRFFSKRLAAVTAVSPEVCRRHQEFLNWRGPTHIVPNGVPAVKASPTIRQQVREEFGVDGSEFVFLAVGNPRPEKAFEDLIAAAALLRQSDPGRKFSIWIAGGLRNDEYCQTLRRLAAEADVPGLRLLGFESDVQRLYSAADALVISSRSEGLPMVVLEAMTAGLPILSTRVGGIPAVVPRACGRLVDAANPSDLASGLSEFLGMDSQQRMAMGQAAACYADRHFGVDAMTSQYLDVFANAN